MLPRIHIFDTRDGTPGKVFTIPLTIEELLESIQKSFGHAVKCLYTKQGSAVDDISLIRDDEILYLSSPSVSQPPKLVDGQTQTQDSVNDWIKLNVGGKQFLTSRSTLIGIEPESMLAKMFSCSNKWCHTRDHDGAVMFDRSPEYFEPLLDYLRNGQLVLNNSLNPRGVLQEAKYFGLTSAVQEIERLIEDEEKRKYHEPLTRPMVLESLLSTNTKCELRYQGVDFSGADLSRLDLRYINFKLSNLSDCNLQHANLYCCSLERADLSGSNLDGANLQGARMICCNAEGCSMKGCNFDDPSGLKANMEGANMKGVNFEGSLMAGVNLRVATLKSSNLKNCDLRGAVLAGTDLEDCDLSGCDLFEANLRGCNVKGTKFAEMITPLHMTQTVPP